MWCVDSVRATQASCAGMLGILLGRIGTGMERPHDRNQVMGVLTLFVLRASMGGGSCGVERKLTKAFLDVHLKVFILTILHCTSPHASATEDFLNAVQSGEKPFSG